jgi:hypothetical protein
MNTYHIESRVDGTSFGYWDGATPKAAFLAMLEEAGEIANYGTWPVGTERDWTITATDESPAR